MRKRILHTFLLLGLLLSVSEGFTQTFALYDNTYKLYPLYNCKEVRFKLSNPYNNEIYYYAYRRTYGTTDWGNPISGWGGGSLASIPANNFVNTDPILLNGDFEYKVVFYSGTDVNNPANLLSDNNILQVRIAPNPGSRLVTFSTSNCIYNTLSIGLQNSQNGVNYQLYYNNGTNKTVVGSPVSGNSSTITFPDILSPSVGVYSISGTDVSTGCISEMLNDKTTLATRTVTSSISASTNPICSGDQVTFTSIVGGNGGVTPNYIWQKSIDGGNSFTDILNETNSNFNSSALNDGDKIRLKVLSNDTYECIANNPAISTSVTMQVTQTVNASISINQTSVVCEGQNTGFSTSVSYQVVTPTYSWFLNNSNTPISGATSSSYSNNNFHSGDILTVKAEYPTASCLRNNPASASVTLTVNPLPILTRLDAIETSSLFNNDGQICSDATATLTPVLGSGTINDYKFIWTAPGSTIIPETASSFQTTSGTGSGTYNLKIENLTTHCQSSTVSNTITIFQIPTVGTISGLNSVCVGKSIQLTASGHSGGQTPYTTFWWYTGTSIGGNTNTPTATVSGVSEGTGEVRYSVEDSKKCVSARSLPHNITVNPLPAKPTAVPSLKVYDAIQHFADATVTGTNVIYEWYDALTSGSLSSQPVQTNVGINTQYAQAKNSITGCVSSERTLVSSEVTKATLTLTANNKEKVYNKATYSGVYNLSSLGFALNESFGNLSGTATYSGTSQSAVNVGTYEIIPSGYSSLNYNIIYVNGTLTISKKDISVQGTTVLTKVYDATISATLTGSSFLTAISAGTGTATDKKPYIGDNIQLATSANFQNKNVGDAKPIIATYSFTSGSTDAGNYSIIQPVGLTGNITKKAVDEINPVTQPKVYDKTYINVGYTSSLRPKEAPGSGSSSDGIAYDSDDISILPSANFLALDVTASGAISSTSTLAGTDAINYTLTKATGLTPRAITVKNLTMSGLTVPTSKIYDGTLSSTVSGGSGVLQTPEDGAINTSADGRPYTGDDVSITGSAIGTYNSKDVISANSVRFSGITLTGAKAGNYTLTIQADATATITPKALTFTGLTVPVSRVYNGNRLAVVTATPSSLGTLQTSQAIGSGSNTDGIPYIGDIVNLSGTPVGTYNTKDVSTANTVTFSGVSLTGAQSTNYSLTPHISQSATITQKTITITGALAANKIYDATTKAIVTNGQLQGIETIDASTVILTQSGTFASKDVGNNITVTSTCSISGADAPNYLLTQPVLVAKNITKKQLTMSGLTIPASKVYDATTVAVVSGTPVLQSLEAPGEGANDDGKPYTGDIVNISGTGVGTYDSKDVLTASKVTFSSLSLTGSQAGNYSLKIQEPILATITKKKLTMFGLSVADTKVYDGNRNAKVLGNSILQDAEGPGTGTVTDGKPYTGDIVNVDGAPTALYNSKNVVEATKVSFAGLSLSGIQASNYELVIQDDYPAKITPLLIKLNADKQTKVYGDDDPEFTYTNDPIIEGDSFNGKLSRVEGQNVGAYSILQGSLDLGTNYTITYKSDFLVITEASMYIKPDTTFRVYGDKPLEDGLISTKFKVMGLKYNETVKSVRLYFPTGLGSGNDPKDSVGLYTFGVLAKDPSGGSALASNYKIVSFPGDIRVKQFVITITADPKTKRQSEEDPPFTYKLSDKLLNSDTVSGKLERDPGEVPGTYPIRQGTLAINNNYKINYLYDMLTVLTVENIFVLPNAFTPNGDGLNDVLKILHNSSIVGINYFRIFDKSGKLVFETKNIEDGWDGRLNGIMQESDAYYWFAEFNTWNKLIFQRKGTVVLLK